MKLKLSDIRTEMPFTMNRGLSVFTIHDVLKYRDFEIDFDVYLPTKKMNLQRPFVWNSLQKQELVLSLLKGIEIPPMALISYDHKIYRVIDGKQRLSTWISFAKNEFPLIIDHKPYYFQNLDEKAQYVIMHTYIKADVAYEYPDRLISDEWRIKWFELINFAGTPQDREHMLTLKQ
jgi:hypothetical protein